MSVRRRAFTLVELLVVVAIFAILLMLVLMGVNSARSSARSIQCVSNLRQIAIGLRNYESAHNGRLPDGIAKPWFEQIASMVEDNESVFRCPDDPRSSQRSYGYRDENMTVPSCSLAGKKFDYFAKSDLVMVFDAEPGWHAPGMVNVALANGSALTMEEEEFQDDLLRSTSTGQYLGD